MFANPHKLDNHSSPGSNRYIPPGERPTKRPRLGLYRSMNGNPEDSSRSLQQPAPSVSRATSTTNVRNGSGGGGSPRSQLEHTRRGYSDGDTPSSRQNTGAGRVSGVTSGMANRRQSGGDQLETWQSFLGHVPTDEGSRRLLAMQRAMVENRRRQEERDEVGRRGDASSAHLRERYHSQPCLPPLGLRPQRASNSSGGTQSSRSSRAPGMDARGSLPQPTQNRENDPFRDDEYVLPRWQPDSEVAECPICRRQFAFWFRKHHCRKCGRVVCANCSPHRITIPRQFIVHPPAESSTGSRMTSENVVDLTGDEADGNPHEAVQSPGRPDRSSLGGGQEVRLCNPCVPDPNPLPPPPPYAPPSTPQRTTFPRPNDSRSGLTYPWNPSMPGFPPNTSNPSEAARRREEMIRNHALMHGIRNSNSGYNPPRPPRLPGTLADPVSKGFLFQCVYPDREQPLYSSHTAGNHQRETPFNVPSITPYGSAPDSRTLVSLSSSPYSTPCPF